MRLSSLPDDTAMVNAVRSIAGAGAGDGGCFVVLLGFFGLFTIRPLVGVASFGRVMEYLLSVKPAEDHSPELD